MIKGFIINIWVLLVLSGTQLVASDSLVRIHKNSKFYNPTLSSAYLIDVKSKLKINDIITPKYQATFIQNRGKIPEFGFISSSIWFKF